MLDHLTVMQEFAQIRRGEHPAWSGDRINNSEFFLRQIRRDMPEQAKEMAYDIECNLEAYSEETGLPHRTLEQAQRYLYGQWA